MTIPQIGDPLFQTNFENFCNAMKQNIERLISVQYTKGEPGNSVYAGTAHVGYSAVGNLTNMAAGMLNVIFDTEFDTTDDLQDVNDIIAGTEVNVMVDNDYFTSGGVAPSIMVDGTEYRAIPSLMNNLSGFDVTVNIDDVTGVAYLASPYIFIDNRIAGLNSMVRNHSKDEEIYKTFRDFSVAVYGRGVCDTINHPEHDPQDPATWEWEFEAVPMVPRLYFDDVINEFCWDINGQQTGITAQGIKGDDGISPNMIIAIGTKNGSIVNLNKIQVIDDEGALRWAISNSEGVWGYTYADVYTEIEQPKAGDLVLVFFPDADHITGDPYENAYIGKVYVGTSGVYTYMGYDEDGRCDIFESIREHDHWRLMMSINTYTTGAPRGYLLPADPGQSSTNPSTLSDKVHMTYSEKINQDSEGFAKLHSSPILRGGNPDPTQMSQTNNPPADHIGDWQMDYNVSVQGNMGVQGNSTVHGNMGVQGTTTMQGNVVTHGNATVQGNMEVQGKILGSDFQITGKTFPISISNPFLACVSRFTDISYYVNREVPFSYIGQTYRYKNIGYTLNFTAKLEVTIGMLSAMLDVDVDAAHQALSGYTDDTWGNQNGNVGVQNNKNYCGAFNNTNDPTYSNSGMRSKLYNAIKYIIPINISKTVSIPVYGRDVSVISNAGGTGVYKGMKLFDFSNIISSGTPSDATTPNINQSHIQIGCNTTSETDFSKISYRGLVNTLKSITDHNPAINKDVDVDGTVVVENVYNDYIDASIPYLKYGGVQGVVSKLDNSNTDSALKNKYEVNGKLYYAPLDINIDYYIDIFARVFEYYTLSLLTGTIGTISFGATPVGCLIYRDDNSNKRYMASIWNALNTDNYTPQRISSIKAITSGSFNVERINVELGESVCLTGKHTLNPLVSGSYRLDDGKELDTGTIIYGSGLNSDNIVSIFNTPNTSSGAQVSVQGVTTPSISTNYFDITPRMRMLENNVKICPNNINDGVWQQESNKIYWQSSNEVPIVVIPYEGKVAGWDASSNKGAVKIGVGNLKYGETSGIGSMALHGMLIYPYSPAIVILDGDGDMNAQKDYVEDAIVASGYNNGSIFVNTGRMMGVSDGNTCGINYSVISNGIISGGTTSVAVYDVEELDSNNIDNNNTETVTQQGGLEDPESPSNP